MGTYLLSEGVPTVSLENVSIVVTSGNAVADGNLDCITVLSINTVFNSCVPVCVLETSVENSVIAISGSVGVLGLIFTGNSDCSCETIIDGSGLDTSRLLTTSVLGKSTELGFVDTMVASKELVAGNRCINKDVVDTLFSTTSAVVDGECKVTNDVCPSVS